MPTNVSYEPFILFRISFWYFVCVGSIVVIIVGLIVSWFTNKNQPRVHPDMLSPMIHCLYSKQEKSLERMTYSSVKVTLELTPTDGTKS